MVNSWTLKSIVMKQILLILLTCFSLASFSQPLMGIIASSQNNATTVNYLYGNIMAESFEGTGYQTSGWTETIGTNSGCLVNEDNTDITITGGGSQVLKLVKVITPTATTAASAARAVYSFAATNPTTYLDYYVYISAFYLPTSGNYIYLGRSIDSASGVLYSTRLENYSGELRFYNEIYTGNNWLVRRYPTSGSISLNTWHHVQIKYDVPNMLCAMYVDGSEVYAATITGTPKDGIKTLILGDNNNVMSATTYLDLVNISSTTFFVP